MKTTERFNNAVKKLYTAYHNNELDAMDCKHCAVGNLCDNDNSWGRGIWEVDGEGGWVGSSNRIPDTHKFYNPSGYSNKELIEIECMFLYGKKSENHQSKFYNTISNNSVDQGYKSKKEQKELQFQGLCAVIEYLAELDNIPNPFNFNNLFNNSKQIADKELELISL